MKKTLVISVIFLYSITAPAQKIDSIFFHLYTDSLKKGQHNYISVDGKLSNGHWLPLTSKEIQFSSSACVFEGNDLVLPLTTEEKTVQVKAVLKSDPAIRKEISIWVKTIPDPPHLPTKKEIERWPSPAG